MLTKPNARYFAQLCVDSYRDDLVKARGWKHRKADVEVLFDRAPWGVTYTWRGTSSAKDVIRDLRFVFPWYDREIGWCAAGALKGVDAVWECLEPSLRTAHVDGTPIYCAGHSLGGAEASIMAARLAARGYRVAGLFTIGAPRPAFSGRMAEVLAAAGVPALRIVADGDPVPHLPPGLFTRHPCPETRLFSPPDLAFDHPSEAYLELIPEGMPLPCVTTVTR